MRSLTVVDHYTRESPVIEVDVSLPGGLVAQVLDRVAGRSGLPRSIRVDNGLSYTTNRPYSGLGGQTPVEFARREKRASRTRLSAWTCT
ncbi:MAG: hypothetical protein KAJ43_13300 [Gemmatimonadetes bacterium]|nr:hypothetical protein [Gemmatimonadota bacterium]